MSKFKSLDKKVQKMDVHDLQLTKLSVAAIVLFLLVVWPTLQNWLMNVHWGWYLVIFLVAIWRPCRKVFF